MLAYVLYNWCSGNKFIYYVWKKKKSVKDSVDTALKVFGFAFSNLI